MNVTDCDCVCSVHVKHFGHSNITLVSKLKTPDGQKGKTNARGSEVCVRVCLMAADGVCVSQLGPKEKMQRVRSQKSRVLIRQQNRKKVHKIRPK